ncbi:hypothetical protein J6A64_06435 [bacterium]|nr:hypothetical protein [bacterium]
MQVNNCTYSKYNTPTFTSYCSAISRKLDDVVCGRATSQGDIVELTRKVEDFIKTQTTPDRLLGKGTLGKVFKIDSDYVLKLPVWEVGLGEFKIVSSKFSDLKTYYGDEIISFGQIKILRNVSSTGEHTPIGLSYSFIREHSDKECSLLYEKECFPRLALLPQKSFDNLASDCAKLNEMQGYMFDFKNPNNFVIVGDEIRIVDTISPTLCYNNNSIANIMRAFIWAEGVGREAVFSKELLEPRRDLLKKIVLAGMKHDLPIVGGGSEFVLEEVLEMLCKSNVSVQKFEQKLTMIRKDCPNVNQRLEQTEAYLDTIFDKT